MTEHCECCNFRDSDPEMQALGCSCMRSQVAELEEIIECVRSAVQDDVTGYCHACDEEGGTNTTCYVCTALMHLNRSRFQRGGEE